MARDKPPPVPPPRVLHARIRTRADAIARIRAGVVGSCRRGCCQREGGLHLGGEGLHIGGGKGHERLLCRNVERPGVQVEDTHIRREPRPHIVVMIVGICGGGGYQSSGGGGKIGVGTGNGNPTGCGVCDGGGGHTLRQRWWCCCCCRRSVGWRMHWPRQANQKRARRLNICAPRSRQEWDARVRPLKRVEQREQRRGRLAECLLATTHQGEAHLGGQHRDGSDGTRYADAPKKSGQRDAELGRRANGRGGESKRRARDVHAELDARKRQRQAQERARSTDCCVQRQVQSMQRAQCRN